MALVKLLLRCEDCGFQFVHTQDKRDPVPADCPECPATSVVKDEERERAEGEARIARMVAEGRPPARTTNHSVAMKHAEQMMLETGQTDWNDSGKPGEIAAKAPSPIQSREIQEMTMAMKDAYNMNAEQAQTYADGARNFWQGGVDIASPAGGEVIQMAAGASQLARSEGVDPTAILHHAGAKGELARPSHVVAAVRG